MAEISKFVVDILKRLKEKGEVKERGVEEILKEAAVTGAHAVIPKLHDLAANSTKIAQAVSVVMRLPMYPYDRAYTEELPSLPELPKTKEVTADWVLCENKFCYLFNPFDEGALQSVYDRFSGEMEGYGVISKVEIIRILSTTGVIEAAIDSGKKQDARTLGLDNVDVNKQLDDLLRDAARLNASDIHFEPIAGGEVKIRIRVDGDLRPVKRLTTAEYIKWANIILNRGTKGKPGTYIEAVDDMFVFDLPGGRKIKLRVMMVPVVLPETDRQLPTFVLRILGNQIEKIALHHLGIPNTQKNNQQVRIRLLCERKNGLILVSGPTGSGKTTTLSAVQNEMISNSPNRKYYTVEDPVEISINGVNHVQVNVEAHLTFPRAVKAFLRGDPDVIMVGEIRDKEVANQALTASITGHLVLSTIHTNSAIETITRLVDIGCDAYTVAGALKASTAQRLAKRLCPHCSMEVLWDDLVHGRHDTLQNPEAHLIKLRYSMAPELYSDLDVYPHDKSDKVWIPNPKGCEACDRGYKGRMLVCELLEVTPKIQDLIARGSSLAVIRSQAVRDGFKEMWQHGMALIREGKTSFEELISAVGEREMTLESMKSLSGPEPIVAQTEEQRLHKLVADYGQLLERHGGEQWPSVLEKLRLSVSKSLTTH